MAQGNICPGLDELTQGLLSLLPSGRAWPDGSSTTSTVYRFWQAIAAGLYDWELRACALIEEFFPSTASETLDLWWADYGLPDGCDPYPDLVAKVRGVGGSNCAYFQTVAAAAGWSIACMDDLTAGAGNMEAGCMQVGSGISPATILVRIYLQQSTAYTSNIAGAAMVTGSGWSVGQTLGCGPDYSALLCLMSRMVPAHMQVIYEVIE